MVRKKTIYAGGGRSDRPGVEVEGANEATPGAQIIDSKSKKGGATAESSAGSALIQGTEVEQNLTARSDPQSRDDPKRVTPAERGDASIQGSQAGRDIYAVSGNLNVYKGIRIQKVSQADLDIAIAKLGELPLEKIPTVVTLPTGSQTLFSHNPLFVGREEELQSLALLLKGGQTAAVGQTAAARARGRKEGRPKGVSQKARNKARLAESLYKEQERTIAEICDYLSIAKPTLYPYLRGRGVSISKIEWLTYHVKGPLNNE